MQAQIVEGKNWKDGSATSSLVIHANREDQKEELEALKLLEKAVSDIAGNEYASKIATTQKGSGTNGLFCVDLTAILTLLKSLHREKDNSKELARAWINNWLKRKVKPEWLGSTKKEDSADRNYICRCGITFRGRKSSKLKSRYKKHQKNCAVLKELASMFARCDKFLGKDKRGKEKEEPIHQTKVRKTKRPGSGKSSGKRKRVDRGSKVGRTPRKHNPKGKR
jgi:hypothetical protein